MTKYTIIGMILVIGASMADTDYSSDVTCLRKTAEKIVEVLSDSCACKKKCESEPCSVKRPSDCSDLDKATCKSGIYKIYPENTSGFNVFCEMEKHGGGWTVFQHRKNGKVDFYLDWESYKNGFGKLDGECCLGNDHLHQITAQGKYKLRIDMQDFEKKSRYASYKQFGVGDEKSGYQLSVAGYNGNAGDSFTYHNGQKFSTKDKGNSSICAHRYNGAWWYKSCYLSNLNGLYLKGNHKSYANGINWRDWKGYHYSLKTTTMMIRKA
ncbi:ficolin-1-A-like [Mytilus galloprovincialis]|uniref:ficolin-1-A-like n=1 Tax=Mytilus galloprovincialis TaxID=29158 RepID=UPI003F7CB8DB